MKLGFCRGFLAFSELYSTISNSNLYFTFFQRHYRFFPLCIFVQIVLYDQLFRVVVVLLN